MREQVSKVLEFESADLIDPQQPLHEFGLDSLMAVELRNVIGMAVGTTLPATLVYEYPTIEALADYLLGEIFPSSSPTESPSQPLEDEDQLSDFLSELDHLSESEAQALLDKKLSTQGT
jgi:acyl carrier protein